MNIGDMAAAWTALENRVEESTSAMKLELDTMKMAKHQGRLRWMLSWELVLSGLTALWVGNFAAGYFSELVAAPLTALPALVLFLFALVGIHLSVRHLLLVGDIDVTAPILEAQNKLAVMRRQRVRVTQWVFVCALPAWVIFPLLLGQSVFGPAFLFAVNAWWITANLLFGLLMAPVVDWILRRSRFASGLGGLLAGTAVVEAEAFVREVKRFESD